MGILPEVRYLIPCWKEPTMEGAGPTAHQILYAVQAKSGHDYPIWQRPFFVLLLITNLHGPCRFRVELRLDEMERDVLVHSTDELLIDVGNKPLRVQPVSIMIKSVKLPKPGVYRLSFICSEESLATATIHAR